MQSDPAFWGQVIHITYLSQNLFVSKNKRGCEWPEGHPGETGFHFCGKDRFDEKPYCLKHCAVAYVFPEKEEGAKISNKVA